MVAITEQPIWADNIRQIETDDPVQGGENGIDNIPHQQLANRTAYLKAVLDSLDIPDDLSDMILGEAKLRRQGDAELLGDTDEDVSLASLLGRIKDLEKQAKVTLPVLPIGSILETTKDYQTGDEVTEDIGYGQWERFGEGKVLVGLSTQNDTPIWTKTIGEMFGEYEHQLTIPEMPNHKITMRGDDGDNAVNTGGDGFISYVSGGKGDNSPAYSEPIGDDVAHNNVQPSITIGRWQRVA